MSKRKGARQGPHPAKLTVVNRGLDLFSQPPTDDSIFGIESHKYYTDNKDSYIYFFAGLHKAGGAIADDKVSMVQNMAFSAFSHIEIKINGRQVNMPTPKSFAMVQRLRAFLNMSDDDKKSWGILQGYMPIDSGSDTSGDPNFAHRKLFTSSDDGSGFAGYLGDQPFYLLLGQIPAFGTDEFFPPQVEINIRLYPFNSNWPLISDGADNYKVVLKATPKPYLVAYHPNEAVKTRSLVHCTPSPCVPKRDLRRFSKNIVTFWNVFTTIPTRPFTPPGLPNYAPCKR